MSTSHNLADNAKTQLTVLRCLPLVRDERLSVENGRLRDAIWVRARIFAVAVLLFTASGCIATRNWVDDQINPIKDQLGRQEAQLNNTDAKLQSLRLEHRLVLGSSHGPTFAVGSAALTANGKREIDGFLEDLRGIDATPVGVGAPLRRCGAY